MVSLYVFLPVVYKWHVIVNIDEFISCIDFVLLTVDCIDLILLANDCFDLTKAHKRFKRTLVQYDNTQHAHFQVTGQNVNNSYGVQCFEEHHTERRVCCHVKEAFLIFYVFGS